MEFRSIKEIIDAFCPDMEYRPGTGGNLRLSKCPFCGSKKAYINPKQTVNAFKCHSGKCGKELGFMSLYKELSGQYDARYVDIIAFLDSQVPAIYANKPQVMPTTHEIDRAPLADRHAVYSRLLELLTLDEVDRANLHKRGLSDEQIAELGYKSCPKKEMIPQIIKKLKEEGFSLEGIPGFYKRNGKCTMMLANGFFVPFRTCKGEIQGLQIRRNGDENIIVEKEVAFSDTVDYVIRVKNNNSYPLNLRVFDQIPANAMLVPMDGNHQITEQNEIRWEEHFKAGEEKIFTFSLDTDIPRKTKEKVVVQPRYIWFTSGAKNGGSSCTNYIHFVGKTRDIMYLTEGALKADVTHQLSGQRRSFVAVTGISSLKNMPEIFEQFKDNGVKEVRIAFDMDRIYNERVTEAIEKAKEMVEDAGLIGTVLEWDIDMGKGIDDFTLNYLQRNN